MVNMFYLKQKSMLSFEKKLSQMQPVTGTILRNILYIHLSTIYKIK